MAAINPRPRPRRPVLSDVVVSICLDDRVLGSGFFIDGQGTILTCDHVVERIDQGLTVRFAGQDPNQPGNPVVRIFQSPQPQRLDFAVLRMSDNCLPDGARLFPLGTLIDARFPRNYLSCGYRPAHQDNFPTFADGRILGFREEDLGIRTLQLSSESIDCQQMREGMSGAPILDNDTQTIVGMYYMYLQEDGREIIPIALSLETIAEYWLATNGNSEDSLPAILEEQRLWYDLTESHLLVPGQSEWVTTVSFIDLCRPFLGMIEPAHLGPNPAQDLLDRLRERGQVREFYEHFKETFPIIPFERYIKTTRPIRFINRVNEKEMACNQFSLLPYLYFEGPLGYGKTTLLREITNEHRRKHWFCVHLKVSDPQSTLHNLVKQFFSRMGIPAVFEEGEELEVVRELRSSIRGQIKALNCIGLLVTLDDAEKLAHSIIRPFFEFLRILFEGLTSKHLNQALDLRFRAAGAHSGKVWRDEFGRLDFNNPYFFSKTTLSLHLLSPFHLVYLHEAVHYVLPGEREAAAYAAYMMYYSAGHPYCMAEILRRIGTSSGDVHRHFTEHLRVIRDLIQSTYTNIQDTLRQNSPSLLNFLNLLCLFPVIDYRLLDLLVKAKFLPATVNPHILVEDLKKTIYYSQDLKHPFLDDHIARRLLLTYLRLFERERYLAACNQARNFYQVYLETYAENAEDILLAALEVELCLAEANLPNNPARLDAFIQPGGILDQYHQRIQSKWGSKVDHIFYLLAGKLENERVVWEFHFLVNFLLSSPQVTDDQGYTELKKKVDTLMQPRLV